MGKHYSSTRRHRGYSCDTSRTYRKSGFGAFDAVAFESKPADCQTLQEMDMASDLEGMESFISDSAQKFHKISTADSPALFRNAASQLFDKNHPVTLTVMTIQTDCNNKLYNYRSAWKFFSAQNQIHCQHFQTSQVRSHGKSQWHRT
jgi:hypothetical protein